MRFNISDEEILETWRMVEVEKLDIRYMSVIFWTAGRKMLGKPGRPSMIKYVIKPEIWLRWEREPADFGPIINQRISVTP